MSEKAADESIKETLESIVIAFVLAFVFRAYVVEAFVIPTGSMAPTLLGEHIATRCDQCGYRFTFDVDGADRTETQKNNDGSRTVFRRDYLTRDVTTVCPMCYNHLHIKPLTRISAGDRILVHKYIYSIDEPRRWDVVVFKNTVNPSENYIKRLVGLPGDSLWIIDGNIYVKPFGGHWKIARKTEREAVQRAVWQPIYHSTYVPLDKGLDRANVRGIAWATPWVPVTDGETWDVQGRSSYTHASNGPGVLRFDASRLGDGRLLLYAYNQTSSAPRQDMVEDVRIAASFQPAQPGLSVEMHTTARLNDTPVDAAPERLTARIDANGTATLTRQADYDEKPRLIAQAQVPPFTPGQTKRIELWFVDQELSLWVEGERVLEHEFNLSDISLARDRLPPSASPFFPDIGIRVEGSAVTLHEVELDRDIYYISEPYPAGETAVGLPATGVLIKTISRDPDGTLHVIPNGSPVELETDQFFCLGDNSPRSHDSRYWTSLNEWIELKMFAGHKQRWGVVPRKLLMGRAFFVYFPAPYGLKPEGPNIFPNFGDMRFIH